jgi:predicted transcriptional regulator
MCTTGYTTYMPDPKSTTITVRVSHDLFERLKALADRRDRTLSQLCMLILRDYVLTQDRDNPPG